MRKMQQLRELCCFGLFLVGLAALGHGWLGLWLGLGLHQLAVPALN